MKLPEGIWLRNTSPGQRKTTCPRCSQQRRHKRDLCLSVAIGPCTTAKGPLEAGEII